MAYTAVSFAHLPAWGGGRHVAPHSPLPLGHDLRGRNTQGLVTTEGAGISAQRAGTQQVQSSCGREAPGRPRREAPWPWSTKSLRSLPGRELDKTARPASTPVNHPVDETHRRGSGEAGTARLGEGVSSVNPPPGVQFNPQTKITPCLPGRSLPPASAPEQ